MTELLNGDFGSEVLELHERTWERRSKKGSAGGVTSNGGFLIRSSSRFESLEPDASPASERLTLGNGRF
jgi:hypothetical protein